MDKYNQNTRDSGSKGEDIASEYLKSLGYQIIKKNFHFGRAGEIDIICRDGETIVFVEVKLRKTDTYGSAIEGLSKSKINAIRRIADAYLYVNNLTNVECRFDFVGIDMVDDMPKITYLKNAF